ncbi:MAG: hypothetical protein ACTSXK_00750 [Promethearchaeota archaeon]
MEKIKIDYKISGTKLEIPFSSVCSIIDKPFDGDIIIEYHPIDFILEYVSFEKFIKDVTKNKSTAEELANIIFQKVKNTIKPRYLKVLVDVKKSEAHQPTEVWIDTDK